MAKGKHMGTPHHQQSLRRKIAYVGLIIVLFFVLIFYRLGVVEAAAEAQALREQDRGEVELTGKFVNLSVTGLRGVLVTALWWKANEAQRKNEWSEMELYVRSVTRLQPHYVTPWLFQSWNLSYNVAVLCDRESDQYFYITRGIQLLWEGERQNHYDPEMRYYIGFYNQHKICQADRTVVLLSLYRMSCIDPSQRDPRRFRTRDSQDRQVLNLVEFEKFCQEHPFLVRMLRERVRCNTPDEVVRFLEDNYRLPCLYEEDLEQAPGPWQPREAKLRPMAERFPLLPPSPPNLQIDARRLTSDSPLGDDIDAYKVGRAWYSYAQEVLPEPDPDLPGKSKPITDPQRQRIPRYTTLLFRTTPSRAMSYSAVQLEDNGWFDADGWLITGWFPGDKFSNGKPAAVGTGRNWAKDAWSEAHGMWEDHGRRNNLLFRIPEDRVRMEKLAREFVESRGMQAGMPLPALTEEEKQDPHVAEGYFAATFLKEFEYYRSLSNFPHFYFQSLVQGQEDTIKARKHFFTARRYLAAASRKQALEEFEHPEALRAWKRILEQHEDFKHDTQIQEEAYETELRYLDLYRELHGRQLKQRLALQAFLGQAAAGPMALPAWHPLAHLARPHLLPEPELRGPFESIVHEKIRDETLVRAGRKPQPQRGQQPGQPPGGMPPLGPVGGPAGQGPPGQP